MLYHSWTYLTLIKDIFEIKNNQFTYQEDPTKKPETFELDFSTDEILKENAFKDFGAAGENVDRALNEWKSEYDKISERSRTGQVDDISSNLSTAIDQLP